MRTATHAGWTRRVLETGIFAASILLLTSLGSTAVSAEMPRLSMRVSACVNNDCSRAGFNFTRSTSRYVAELHIKRHADNRRLVVTLYCDGLVVDGPAEMPHEGELAVPVRTREYRSLGPGHYVATAVLITSSGEQFRAAPTQFTIFDVGR